MSLDLSNLRILTVSASRLGDTLFCTPAYRLIKQHFPSATIDVVCLTALSLEVLRDNPYIDRLIAYTDAAADNTNDAPAYDLALNLHDSKQAQAIFNRLALPTLTIPRNYPHEHTTATLLRLLATTLGVSFDLSQGHYELFPTANDFASVNNLLRNQGVGEDDRLVGIHLGCHGLSKKRWRFFGRKQHPKTWPLERFVELIQILATSTPGLTYVITGSQEEQALAQELCSKLGQIKIANLVGLTTVHGLRCLMERLLVYVCADTGVQHVACSSQVPLAALFRSGHAEHTGPFPLDNTRHFVCERDHLANLTAQEVAAVVTKLERLSAT